MPGVLDGGQQADPLIGQTLGGKYTLKELIGQGGMGHVYLAEGTDAGRETVVVKVIAPPLAQQPQAMARFEREAKRLDGLRHSNIVEMYEHGRVGGRAYIAMEYVDGELLNEYLARKGRLTIAEFVPIAAQILKGVGHAHSRDLMIRDIKPANVMLCERKGRANFVKIIDFGLAKMLEGDEDITKQHFIGTSGYLSPEQIKGLEIDLRVDVYALGVLFYQMLSGRMPFEAENDTTLLYKHVHEFPTPLMEVLPEDHQVPDELVHLLHDCLEKDPEQRPADANEIVEKIIDCVPMSMFRLPPAGHDSIPETAGDTGAISALSTAALAAPVGETATYMAVREVSANQSGAGLSSSGLSSSGLDGGLDPAQDLGQTPATGEHTLSAISVMPVGETAEHGGGSKMGLIIGAVVGVVALVGIAIVALGGSSDDKDEKTEVHAGVDLEGSVSEAERQFDAGEFEAAARTLDAVRGQLESSPELSGRVSSLDEKISIGRLMATGAEFDEQGKIAAAISAYEEALETDPSNSEARERLIELRNAGKDTAEVDISTVPVADLSIDGSPAGTTPYEGKLALGKHTLRISAEGYDTWEQEIEVKEGDNPAVKVKLSKRTSDETATTTTATKKKKPGKRPGKKPNGAVVEQPKDPDPKPPGGNNPFLPTKKKKPDGPFLPTQK